MYWCVPLVTIYRFAFTRKRCPRRANFKRLAQHKGEVSAVALHATVSRESEYRTTNESKPESNCCRPLYICGHTVPPSLLFVRAPLSRCCQGLLYHVRTTASRVTSRLSCVTRGYVVADPVCNHSRASPLLKHHLGRNPNPR